MDALLLAVLNALWQGAAVIALVALALRAGLRRNATTACVVWSVAFVLVALLPAIDLVLARPHAPVAPAAQRTLTLAVADDVPAAKHADGSKAEVVASRGMLSTDRSAVVRSGSAPETKVRATLFTVPAKISLAQRLDDAAARAGSVATSFARTWALAVGALWALVCGTLLLRLILAYAAIARMKRGARPLDDAVVLARLRAAGHRRHAEIASSSAVQIPCAIGFRRPMILLPERLVRSLDADDLARVVLHESAHLQRYDDWTNALEQLVCAVQFFQPALYVARRGIDFEREVACDDRVLEEAGEPIRYAECLARIVQRHAGGRRAVVVPGFVLRRAQVVARVRRIVDRSRDASPHLRTGAAVLAAFVLVATFGIARFQVPLVAPAEAQSAPAPPASPANVTTPRHAAAPATPANVDEETLDAVPAAKLPKARALPPLAKVRPIPPLAKVRPIAPLAKAGPLPKVAPLAKLPRFARLSKVAPLPPLAEVAPLPKGATLAPLPKVAPLPPLPNVAPLPPLTKVVPFTNVTSFTKVTPFTKATPFTKVTPVTNVASVTSVAAVSGVAAVATSTAASSDVRVAPVAPAAMVSVKVDTSRVAPVAVRATVIASSHSDGDMLDAIDEAKYPHPSIDELIELKNQGVNADYIRRMGALGRARPSLREVLALAVQGITPDYIAALDRRLAGQPTFDGVIALHAQGITPGWLDGLAAAGYPRLKISDAEALAVQGVTPAYVRDLTGAGLRNVSIQQLLALRVQGVDGSFVRTLARHGYKNLSPDEVVRLKVSGFEP
jgi:beta-lactamase regulating signal transducer with metallopeptidase domain